MTKDISDHMTQENLNDTDSEQYDSQQLALEQNINQTPIYVTQPFLPPLEEFTPYLDSIWQSKILTNAGPLHNQFERELAKYLGVPYISLFNNGTIALLTALQALRIKGEVITTPYSFVATAHSLLWNGLKPIFVDIEPDGFNLDPSKIEAAITPQTTAILPVHCYGNPCNTQAIQEIADNFNLKVIYDAAHAFNIKDVGGSILRHGDLSVLSFHATKIFNTFEGGAIISPDAKTKKHIDHLKNFGFVDEVTVVAAGINGKMSEINAALGLLQLKYIDDLIQKRKEIDQLYRDRLKGIAGVQVLAYGADATQNYSYFPVIIDENYPLTRDQLYNQLKSYNIYTRRYFYPLINDFPMYRGLASAQKTNLPHATQRSQQVLCLPIYPDMAITTCNQIIDLIAHYGKV